MVIAGADMNAAGREVMSAGSEEKPPKATFPSLFFTGLPE
jgi:hypothetical protein